MKLWQKDKDVQHDVESFTVGKDREMDLYLARFDVLGSLAHIHILESIGLLTKPELEKLSAELRVIYKEMEKGGFVIEEGTEDVHSQIEHLLTKKLGDTGKKIHSGRSRNDQVLVDIRLLLRDELEQLVHSIRSLFDLLINLSNKHKDDLLPGYTHLQLAMPSSFGLWFGAYAESLVDDVITIVSAYRVTNKNPLGSAAGYGSSFPLNRKMTTELLGFATLNYNVVYAQMGRGKTERIAAAAMANVAATLSKLAMDVTLFMNQNFGFVSFPDELTTGSSIMPHKKNPDVFEIIRGRCNQIAALPNTIMMMTANLPSGYHRDLQLLKELLFPAFGSLRDCIAMAHMMLSAVKVKQNILDDEKYKYLFTVEEVNKLVQQGVPFRDAYRQIGEQVEKGSFKHTGTIKHTHEGSIGNLCNDDIVAQMDLIMSKLPFATVHKALEELIGA